MDVLGIEPKVWFPVVTLIVGGALKWVGDLVTHRRTSARERAARQEQRRDAARIRQIDFQRDTLLELQDFCQQLARHTGRINFEDSMAYRDTGHWGRSLVSAEVSEGSRACQAGISKLRGRVRNDAIRQQVLEFSAVCAAVVTARAKDKSDSAFNRMGTIQNELNEQIGSVLRTLDDDEDSLIGSSGA
ncbi:hypothetical protein P0D72_26035 [Paraburkholderia sediminicola]|uniref:hypothetical protein n=1 Tax=Paraburkholderia sediminicola TaxID=458836 RepID=UPI0038BA2458